MTASALQSGRAWRKLPRVRVRQAASTVATSCQQHRPWREHMDTNVAVAAPRATTGAEIGVTAVLLLTTRIL